MYCVTVRHRLGDGEVAELHEAIHRLAHDQVVVLPATSVVAEL
jgi:hypothetical protein